MRIFIFYLLILLPLASHANNIQPVTLESSSVIVIDTLNLQQIRSQYSDGNLDSVVLFIDSFRAKHTRYSLRDSVFIAKYLGVVFTANPDSKEKGKYWFYKMLQLAPRENLLDLYVGESVEHTFDKVKEEFIVRRNYQGVSDTKLAKAVQNNTEPGKRDTIVRRDTIVLKGDNWASPITDVVKDGLSEVKGGIKAGIKSGYVPIQEESVVHTSSWTGNVNLGAGIKYLDDDWSDKGLTDQTEFRLSFDIRQRGWPINIALDAIYAQSSDVFWNLEKENRGTPKVNLRTLEFNVGVRKIFDFKLYSVRPFFGGGFGRVQSKQTFSGRLYNETFNDGKISYWFNGGIYWELNRHFNIGLEALSSHAKIDIFGIRNHGGTHFDMLLGFHF